jgi:hypothetical protein
LGTLEDTSLPGKIQQPKGNSYEWTDEAAGGRMTSAGGPKGEADGFTAARIKPPHSIYLGIASSACAIHGGNQAIGGLWRPLASNRSRGNLICNTISSGAA